MGPPGLTSPTSRLMYRNFTGAGVTVADNAGTGNTDVTISSGGGGAPTTATYIVKTPDAALTNAQATNALTSGFVTVAGGTGVLSSQATVRLNLDVGATVLPTANGGMGQANASFNQWGVGYANTTTSMSVTAAPASSGLPLISNSVGAPSFTSLALAGSGNVSGQLPVANGGTGNASGNIPGSAASANAINGAVITVANHTATGTPSATTYYRGDNTWSTPSGGGGVGTMTRLTAAWASSATANTLGIIGTAGVPLTSPSIAISAPFAARCVISTTRAATTNGPRYGVTSSTTLTRVAMKAHLSLAGTQPAYTESLQRTTALTSGTCTTGCTAAMTSGALAVVMEDEIEIIGQMGAAGGTVSLQMAPSAAAANTAQIGSYCVWY
jgi:hypothetical protein